MQKDIKIEVAQKKKCDQVQCPFENCEMKVHVNKALLHMSIHQLNNDSTEPICAFCGSEGHMPTLSDSKKKWEFGDLCAFGGHTLNVKKLTTIECSLPIRWRIIL